MQVTWLPDSVCEHVDKKIRNFIWAKGGGNRSWNLVSWKRISCPKEHGGLGLRSTRFNNICLLGKNLETMLHDKQKFWPHIFQQKYLCNDQILAGSYAHGNSYIWRSFIKAKEWLARGFKAQLGDEASSLWYDDWLGTGKICNRVPFVNIADTLLKVSDLWVNNHWCFDFLYTVLPLHIVDEITQIEIPSQRNVPDRIAWQGTNDGSYTTSSAYALLCHEDAGPYSASWKKLWRCQVPEKIRFFLWLVKSEALPTNAKRHHNHLVNSAACSRCTTQDETLCHLFRDCPASRHIWLPFACVLPAWTGLDNFQTWFEKILRQKNNVISIAVLWWLWRYRNEQVLGSSTWSTSYVLRQIHVDVRNWTCWPGLTGLDLTPTLAVAAVPRQQHHQRRIFADGSYDPRRRCMGAAAVLLDQNGYWITGISHSYGYGNAFLAELLAIELGLLLAWDLGMKDVVCYSDCLDAVTILSRDDDARSYWARDAINRVRAILQRNWTVAIDSISREKNKVADALARRAVMDRSSKRFWPMPPSSVIAALCLDSVV